MANRRHVRYSQLGTDDDDGDYDGSRSRHFDPRFDYTPKGFDRIPWKSIALALFLLCLGSLLLFLSLFIISGHMGGEKSQAYGLLVLGILTFLPVSSSKDEHSHSSMCEDILIAKAEIKVLIFLPISRSFNFFLFIRVVLHFYYDPLPKPYLLMSSHFRPDHLDLDHMALGFYETRIAYYSWRGANGYRFASIPNY
ncbi:hypothetical protein JRO89_XS12G0233300 [Xanthoceras sorbifolium]|uniref:Transmembrane protein 230 n=1 Tax=Xanthoceras sorbifolium TaxID=99658 RepID=A0ABQ8HDH0_9ROSI|nr:hypothetical protein JRO89_XS12G0233300 [Xanthoceras sorbifolium]